jgi:hypothetical protein
MLLGEDGGDKGTGKNVKDKEQNWKGWLVFEKRNKVVYKE